MTDRWSEREPHRAMREMCSRLLPNGLLLAGFLFASLFLAGCAGEPADVADKAGETTQPPTSDSALANQPAAEVTPRDVLPTDVSPADQAAATLPVDPAIAVGPPAAQLPKMEPVAGENPLRDPGEPAAPTVATPPAATPPAAAETATTETPAQPAPTQTAPIDAAKPAKAPPEPYAWVKWPQPQVVLFVTGQQMGYIEPCGCTGLENQKGGLARRHSLLTQLREKWGDDVVPVDVGSQVRRYGKQSEIKFQQTASALQKLGYQAVTFGKDDLRLNVGELFAGTNNSDGSESIFTSVNVALLARELQPRYRIVEAGGRKIGIIGVLGDEYEKQLQGDELVHEGAIESLKAGAAELKQAGCDYLVLLAHASMETTKKIAAAVPVFQLVVTAGGVGEPTRELTPIEGTKSQMVQVGTKGMYVGLVALFDDAANPVRYERVPLDSRLPDSPAMLTLLAEYQKQLETLGLEELGLRPQPHPSGRTFVGTSTCVDCHTQAGEVWANSKHAHATDSLVTPPNTRGDIARHYDPECLSCHVTGWEPQKFYPFKSGYESLEKTPVMAQSGCENCHGPGSAHVAAESGSADMAELLKRREEMKLPLAGGVAERRCMECHDIDNSPDFHVKGAFEKYWKQVEHIGKD